MSDKPFLIQQKLWLDPNEKIEAEKFQQIWSERVRQLKLINEELSSVQASELKDLAVRAVAVRDTWKHQLRLNERYPFPEEARQFLSRLDNLMEFIEKNQEAMHHFERHPVIRNAHPYGGALGSLLKSYRFAASLQREHQGNVGRKRNLLVRVVVSDAMSALAKILSRKVRRNWKLAPGKGTARDFVNADAQWISEVTYDVLGSPPEQVKSALEALSRDQKSKK